MPASRPGKHARCTGRTHSGPATSAPPQIGEDRWRAVATCWAEGCIPEQMAGNAEVAISHARSSRAKWKVGSSQSWGSAAKSRLVFRYHVMPEIGRFHRPFIAFKASACVPSPPATLSLRCLSWSLITSSAVVPRSGRSQGPPSFLHDIVFMTTTLRAPARRVFLRSCSERQTSGARPLAMRKPVARSAFG